MSEEEKCRELAKLPNFLKLDKPLPQVFLEHTRCCEDCLFWTSYALAAQKASRTTNRIIQDESCPSGESFGVLLLTTLRGIKAGHTKKIKQDIFYIDSKDFSVFHEIKEHVNGDNPKHCPWCRTYYDEIFNVMTNLQKEYEADILSGKSVKPTIEDETETIPASKITQILKKKPN